MKIITDVGIVDKIRLNYSNEVCEKHLKKVRKLLNEEGKAVCPTCFTTNLNEELKAETLQKIELQKMHKKYNVLKKQSLVPDMGLEKSKISNFYSYCEETDTNKKEVVNLLQRIMRGESISVWFSGNTGVGKSHLAMAMLQVLNEASLKEVKEVKTDVLGERLSYAKACLFVNVNMLMDAIRESFNDNNVITTPKYMIDLLTSVDFLVLDDVGSEVGAIETNKRATDFVTKTMYSIVNGRQEKTTIYTTNLSSKTLKKLYDDKAFSRMTKNAESIVFKTSKDQRGGKLDF